MSTCRMTPNIRRNRQTNPTMPYSPPLKLATEANGHVSADDLLDLMDKTHPGEYPISRIMRELGSLELEGRISMRSGWIIAEQR